MWEVSYAFLYVGVVRLQLLGLFGDAVASEGAGAAVREKGDEDERLHSIGIGLLQTGELSLLQAKKEVLVYARRTYRMFNFVRSMMDAQNEKELHRIYARVEKYEEISDRVEVDILSQCERVGDSLINISEDIVEIHNPQLKVQEIRYVQPADAPEA